MSGYVRVKSAFRCSSHTNKVSCRNACNGNPANQSNLVKGIEKLSRSQMKPSLNIHSKQLLIWASYCHECGEHSNLQVYWCWPTTGQAWLPLPEFRRPPISDQQPSQMKQQPSKCVYRAASRSPSLSPPQDESIPEPAERSWLALPSASSTSSSRAFAVTQFVGGLTAWSRHRHREWIGLAFELS